MNAISMWLIRQEIQALKETRTGLEAMESNLKNMWNKLKTDTKTVEKDLRDLADNVKAIREE
jgi:septal ring factor EnvC (AmiA/AmiB activator)